LTELEYRKIKQRNLQKILPKISQYFWIKPNSRRKITLQIGTKNEVGFFAKASNNLIEIDKCYVSEDKISNIILPIKNFLKTFENNLIAQIQITLFDNGLDLIFIIKREFNFTQTQKITQFAKDNKINISYKLKNEVSPIFLLQNNQILINNKTLNLTSDIFIQATTDGIKIITQKISEFILQNFAIKPKVIDIYAGFGIYSFAIADFVKEIHAFEGDEEMTKLIQKNSTKNCVKIFAKNRDLFFYPISAKELKDFDLVIINPPRNGATPQIKEIAKSKLQNLIYVSCNPKTFAFDIKILTDAGFVIEKIFAIDQFYGTNHFEILAYIKK